MDYFRLKALGFGAASQDGVITAEALSELQEANTVLLEAEKRASEMDQRAREAYEAEKVRGYEEGMQAANAARAAQIIEDQHQIEGKLVDLERDLGVLVFNCVQRIIEGFDDQELALQVARSALASMRKERRGQLFVSRQAFEATQNAMPALVKEFPEIELIDVIEDVELTMPNVRLESNLGVVAFVLDETLESLQRMLEQK